MQKPSRKTMIVAGAASAGLIVLGSAVAVAESTGTSTPAPAASSGTSTAIVPAPDASAAAAGHLISGAQAQRIALRTVPGARVTQVDFDAADPNDEDVSDRVAQWEIDLARGNTEYDVDIDAHTGRVLKNRSEVDDDSNRQNARAGSDSDDDAQTADDHGQHQRHGDDSDDD